ncbi:MAG TPA: BON domain-containing protein, partial [Longimicrobiales bacterium]|nr:BON domain-containing protein [Longimicrobiales bacterium]
MAYDRDFGSRGPRRRGGSTGRGEHGTDYEAPLFRGDYDMGYEGGALRSRGSWIEGARRAGQGAPYDEEFEWGGGYVGGRGYGGTNYDYEHGYQTNISGRLPRGGALRPRGGEFSSPASRGGYAWGEEVSVAEEYGPARYGYGPYFDRLQRRRRPDQELRQEVEDALFYDTWVDADAIEITVRDGVVTLSGTLPSYDEIRFAVDDAWDVDGVRGVRSEMEVAGEAERGERTRVAGRRPARAGREAAGLGEPSGRGRERAGMEEPSARGGARGETGRRGATGRGAGGARG